MTKTIQTAVGTCVKTTEDIYSYGLHVMGLYGRSKKVQRLFVELQDVKVEEGMLSEGVLDSLVSKRLAELKVKSAEVAVTVQLQHVDFKDFGGGDVIKTVVVGGNEIRCLRKFDFVKAA